MNERDRRSAEANKRRMQLILPLSVGGVLVVFVAFYYLIATEPIELDERHCPKITGPLATTVLLLDTSDPYLPKHREVLVRLFEEARDNDGRMPIGLGELLVVYELTENPGEPRVLKEICRPPKDFDERTWKDDIREGRVYAERDWEKFNEKWEKESLPSANKSQNTSPLVETIGVLAARHAPGKFGSRSLNVHFIIFSDLLQHTSRLSHYRTYPDASDLGRGHRDLLTDLTGAAVSLYRLERPEVQHLQTTDHYYWWPEYIRESGGNIRISESI